MKTKSKNKIEKKNGKRVYQVNKLAAELEKETNEIYQLNNAIVNKEIKRKEIESKKAIVNELTKRETLKKERKKRANADLDSALELFNNL
ncbi:hypothetical protein HDV01_004486 [Terramyces sp. JEL0728]|nr:hypothetical protein HDV01_004486 [Terramyces sp. JEL0728]